MDFITSFREMISLRGLTDHTIKSYSTYIKAYLEYLQNNTTKSPENADWQDLRNAIFFIQQQRQLSDRTVNALISQLRFFTIYVLHKPWDSSQLPTRKFDTYLPFVPSVEEVKTFIEATTNLKQKAIIVLMYSAGLRVGEVRHLKCSDIEVSSKRILIRHSKNRAQRYAILADYAWDIILNYWHKHGKPRDWLFPSSYGNSKPVSHGFAPEAIKRTLNTLNWDKPFTCHCFRHAFGTHLYENGTDLLTIKNLLGHKSINSTTVYVHLAKNTFSQIKSPLDVMFKEES